VDEACASRIKKINSNPKIDAGLLPIKGIFGVGLLGNIVPAGANAWQVCKITKPGETKISKPYLKSTQSQRVSDYLKSSTKQLFLGNYTDDVTLLGTAAQIGTGLLGVDLLGDIRDIRADFKNWKWTWGHTGQTALDAVGLIPLIGVVKYGDEVGTLFKGVNKADDFKVEKIVEAGSKSTNKIELVGDARKFWTSATEYNGIKVY